uniref:Glycoprotein A33 n=1 Tax=Sphenodon punctatus TaxID=8508 RepID=A0A8D0HRC5_SPHPU
GEIQEGDGYQSRIGFTGVVNSGDASVVLKKVTMEDNGTYICSVRLRHDPPMNAKSGELILLSLSIVAPSKPECKILGTTEYGHNINLTCHSDEGSPKPVYTWQSFNVQNQPRALAAPAGEMLTLKNISADTSGFYICTSTNSVGHESCNITVAVMPPSMNFALYAGAIGGALVAIILIGVLVYCCCCRGEQGESQPVKIRGPAEEEVYEEDEAEEDRWEDRPPMPTTNKPQIVISEPV